MAEENTARAVEGNAVRFRPSPLPGHVKPNAPNQDIAWEWNSLKDINNRKQVTCDFCGKITTGGITRAKRHQMGVRGDCGSCHKCPEDVKETLKAAFINKKNERDAYLKETDDLDEDHELVEEISAIRQGKRAASMATSIASSQTASTAKKPKGPLDLLYFKNPESTIRLEGKASRQTSINDACDKEARARTIQYIERFLCRNSIPFNVLRTKSFKLMVEAIGNYGKHLKPPSYHEARVPLLKKELEYTRALLQDHVRERERYGCSIMSDGWTDRKNRTLINFLVHCPRGSMFIRSVDASSYVKTGEQLYKLLDDFVEEIGESNVVQVVTDNGSNYVKAGKLLMATRTHLFWTPCAAHCLDLMLEDIGKLPRVKRTIKRGISLVGYIYNHTLTLNIMRQFTHKKELVRHGVTRFATTFLTLQRLYSLKNDLRKMFISDEWLKSNNAKETKGKRVADIVLMPTFWGDVIYSLKAMAPIVKVLRLVDNEKRPAMGYIYEAMDRAKESIRNSFKGDEAKFKEIFSIIDRRWECQLHHPLHAAGHYLNPQFFYGNPQVENDPEVMDGLYKCIERLSTSSDDEDKALDEISLYRRAAGLFGIKAAIRKRSTMAPAEWWVSFGSHTPKLQTIAIKVLSLTCSSSGCERNWSMFEQVHAKKRNRLEHQRLQDLVYIKYNQTLRERFDCQDVIDPIVLDDVEDDTNEWVLGRMEDEDEEGACDLVFDDDVLTWRDVAEATGATEPLTYTRRSKKGGNTAAAPTTSRKGKEVIQAEEEEEEFDSEDIESDGEEIYLSGDEDDAGDEEPNLEDEDDDAY